MLTARLGARAARTLARRGAAPFSATAPSRQEADEDKDSFTLSFASPYGPVYEDKEVAAVYVPGEEGDVGIAPGHVPIMVQLRPGVVRVAFDEAEDADTEDWFVSGGFAITQPDSTTTIGAAEAYALSDFDPDVVERNLARHQANVDKAEEDSREQIEAQIALDTCSALAAALGVGSEGED